MAHVRFQDHTLIPVEAKREHSEASWGRRNGDILHFLVA